MKARLQISKLEPNAYKAMGALEKYLSSSIVKPNLRELIKIRSSQINGCAYCIELHTKTALELGEDQRKIFALPAWKESPLFSQEERIILKMTEEITHISDNGLTEETYRIALDFFSQNEIAQIIMQIGTINLWNRMAVSTKLQHPK